MFEAYSNDFKLFFIILLNVILFTIIFYFFTSKDSISNSSIILTLMTLIISIIWIWFAINFLLSLLNTISILFNIPKLFINLTILPFGNNIPELIFNLKLSKLGYREMSLSGSISKPLFNLLIGLGLSLSKIIIKKGKITFDHLKNNNIISIVFIIFSFINIISLGLEVAFLKFHLNVRLAFVRLVFYLLFILLFCIMIFFKS